MLCCFVLIRKSGSGPCILTWAPSRPYLCGPGPGRRREYIALEKSRPATWVPQTHLHPQVPQRRKRITSTNKTPPAAFPSVHHHRVRLHLSGLRGGEGRPGALPRPHSSGLFQPSPTGLSCGGGAHSGRWARLTLAVWRGEGGSCAPPPTSDLRLQSPPKLPTVKGSRMRSSIAARERLEDQQAGRKGGRVCTCWVGWGLCTGHGLPGERS